MRLNGRRARWSARISCGVLALALTGGFATPAGAANLTAIAPATGAFDQEINFVRTSDGVLHLVYITNPGTGADDGFQSRMISPSGTVGPAVQALSGWQIHTPGLAKLADGELLAVFGSLPPSPFASGAYESISTNGGSTWSAPGLVSSGSTLEDQIYGSTIEPFEVGSTPVLATTSDGITVQSGLGAGALTTQVPLTSSDDYVGELSSAQDAATGEIVSSWQSEATPGGDFVQGVWPSTQASMLVRGQRRNWLVISPRDTGPGVFGAFTPNGSQVRMFRYGSPGSVKVGSLPNVSAQSLGTATGLDGRIWVMWGDTSAEPKIAMTRSNRAGTRFEPIQTISTDAFSLTRIVGDGRLGPLDLFVDEERVHAARSQIFYARVLPELSASASAIAVKHMPGRFIISVRVTDAGDAVAGATVSVNGAVAQSKASGDLTLSVSGSVRSKLAVTITKPGYRVLRRDVTL